MYSVVIIDDEYVMRDGLTNLIDWGQMGFYVAGVFEDGARGVAWLKTNHADIVLTDLKMGGVSGIDVARYIHENALSTKVVIISGYSDFDAAQQAMELRVDSFLLKPISIKRIKQVLSRIAEELRQMDAMRQAADTGTQDGYLEGCFAEDLLSGVLQKKERLDKYVKMLGWERAAGAPCALVEFRVHNHEALLGEFDGDRQTMADFLWGIFKRSLVCCPLRCENGNLLGLILDSPDPAAQFEATLRNINSLVNIHVTLTEAQTYATLEALAAAWPYAWSGQAENPTLPQIRERQQIVMTHILKNDVEQAQSHFHAFLSSIGGDMGFVRSSTIDFFAGLVERLRHDNRFWEQDAVFPYSLLSEASTQEGLRTCGAQMIVELAAKALAFKSFSKTTLVQKACAFIDENYAGDITLEQTAAHLFISPVYLSRIFKEATGVTFKNYIIDKRMEKACALLDAQDNGIKVYEVCQRVGYRDVRYFYQVFSKRMGCTPMEYKTKLPSLRKTGKAEAP